MAVLLLSLSACKSSYVRPAEPPKPPEVSRCLQARGDPSLPAAPAVNDQVQWVQVYLRLVGIITGERNVSAIERRCVLELIKSGVVR